MKNFIINLPRTLGLYDGAALQVTNIFVWLAILGIGTVPSTLPGLALLLTFILLDRIVKVVESRTPKAQSSNLEVQMAELRAELDDMKNKVSSVSMAVSLRPIQKTLR